MRSIRWLLASCMVVAVCSLRAEDDFKFPPFKGDAAAPGAEEKPDLSKLSKKELDELKARNRLLADIARTLKKAQRIGGGKASPEDFFLVGKVEMELATKDAKVEFTTFQGLENATNALAEFVTTTPQSSGRYYQAFARFGNTETAEAGLVEIRQRYDAAVEYREKLAAAYKAKTMCRS